MNALTEAPESFVPFTGHHRKVFDCIRIEVQTTERYCRSSSVVGQPEACTYSSSACDRSATLINGMTYPYAVFSSGDQDRELVAFSDLARAHVRTLWRDAVGAPLDDKAQDIRQRYQAELERLSGNSATSAG